MSDREEKLSALAANMEQMRLAMGPSHSAAAFDERGSDPYSPDRNYGPLAEHYISRDQGPRQQYMERKLQKLQVAAYSLLRQPVDDSCM